MENLYQEIKIEDGRITFIVPDEIRKKYLTEDLYVSYEPVLDLDSIPLQVLIMPYLLNIAPLVWATGGEYSVPELSTGTMESLEKCRAYYEANLDRSSWNCRIHAEKQADDIERVESGCLVFFTRGIDSAYSALSYRHQRPLLVHVLRTHGVHRDESVQKTTHFFRHLALPASACAEVRSVIISGCK